MADDSLVAASAPAAIGGGRRPRSSSASTATAPGSRWTRDAAAADRCPQRIDLRSAAATLAGAEAGVFAQARALLHWRSAQPLLRRLRRRHRVRARRLARALRACGARTLPAHRSGDHRRGQRWRTPAARPPGRLAGAALLGARRFRRAGRIAGADGGARSVRGNRRARAPPAATWPRSRGRSRRR